MSIPAIKKINYALEKVLSRCSVDENTMPSDLAHWHALIERVNNSFNDFEQERYLLERSMDISSREFLELRDRFESAEATARIGHWSYFSVENKVLWSKEVYRIFGVDPSQSAPSYLNFLDFLHEDDKEKFKKLVEKGLISGENYEMEFRVTNKEGDIIWVYVKANATPLKKPDPQKKFLYNLNGVVMEITERKKAEEIFLELNKNLIGFSRRAGMSEVATAVLHNIGNILNSTNTAISVLKELIQNSDVDSLHQVAHMVNQNMSKNPLFLTADEKGKLIPEFLIVISESIRGDYKKISDEANEIFQHLEHIRQIVLMQNQLSGVIGLKEKVLLSKICDQAIEMSIHSGISKEIEIKREYEYTGLISLDKTKVTQILVNLIGNAKDSIKLNKNKTVKKLTVIIDNPDSENFITIRVIDNGVGILPQDINKIFSFGFTTKVGGHGFGLHSSALAANEMGGSLIANSHGLNKGAEFILRLPFLIDYAE